MDNKKISAQLGIGTPSIIMIFIVVIMGIVAILSYLNAVSYYNSTYQQANNIVDYYAAQSKGLELYYQLNHQMSDKELNEILSQENIVYRIDENMITYQCDVKDDQYVLFEINKKDLTIKTIKQCNKVE